MSSSSTRRPGFDDDLMDELVAIKERPTRLLALQIADGAMRGQDAIKSAVSHRRLGVTGLVATTRRRPARGGAALSGGISRVRKSRLVGKRELA